MSREFIIGNEDQTFTNGVTFCPVCGKKFYIARGYLKQYNYRKINKNKKSRYACSYSCFNKMKDEITCSWKFKPEVKEK